MATRERVEFVDGAQHTTVRMSGAATNTGVLGWPQFAEEARRLVSTSDALADGWRMVADPRMQRQRQSEVRIGNPAAVMQRRGVGGSERVCELSVAAAVCVVGRIGAGEKSERQSSSRAMSASDRQSERTKRKRTKNRAELLQSLPCRGTGASQPSLVA